MKIKLLLSALFILFIVAATQANTNKKYLTGTVNVDYPVKIEIFKGTTRKNCHKFFNETITDAGEDYSISIPHTGYIKVVFKSYRSTIVYYVNCADQNCTIDVDHLK